MKMELLTLAADILTESGGVFEKTLIDDWDE